MIQQQLHSLCWKQIMPCMSTLRFVPVRFLTEREQNEVSSVIKQGVHLLYKEGILLAHCCHCDWDAHYCWVCQRVSYPTKLIIVDLLKAAHACTRNKIPGQESWWCTGKCEMWVFNLKKKKSSTSLCPLRCPHLLFVCFLAMFFFSFLTSKHWAFTGG